MSQLSEEEIRRLLNRKDRWVALSTVGPGGFPHTIPIGYFLMGEKIVMGGRDGTQKVKNIERDARVSVMWDNGRDEDSLIGIVFQGHARIVREPGERLALKQEACRQRGEEIPTEITSSGVYIEVTPKKTMSWNLPRRSRGR